MMIDFALEAERNEGKNPRRCDLPGLPAAVPADHDDDDGALLGGLPLALGTGTGSELRRPLGISIVGGLMVSQMLTLFTTPVVYLYMDRVRLRFARRKQDSQLVSEAPSHVSSARNVPEPS